MRNSKRAGRGRPCRANDRGVRRRLLRMTGDYTYLVFPRHRCGGGGQDAFRGEGCGHGRLGLSSFFRLRIFPHGPELRPEGIVEGTVEAFFGLGVAFSRSDLLRRYDFRRGLEDRRISSLGRGSDARVLAWPPNRAIGGKRSWGTRSRARWPHRGRASRDGGRATALSSTTCGRCRFWRPGDALENFQGYFGVHHFHVRAPAGNLWPFPKAWGTPRPRPSSGGDPAQGHQDARGREMMWSSSAPAAAWEFTPGKAFGARVIAVDIDDANVSWARL